MLCGTWSNHHNVHRTNVEEWGTGAKAKAWCIVIQWKHLSLSRGPGREPGASLHTRKRLSLTGGRAKRESLVPPYIRGSVSLTGGGAKRESLVPPYSRGSVSLSRGAGRNEKAWCLLIHAEESLSQYAISCLCVTRSVAAPCRQRRLPRLRCTIRAKAHATPGL